jgi:energy-coupling factor transport system permease protein
MQVNAKIKLLALIVFSTSMVIYPNGAFIAAMSAILTALMLALRAHRRFVSWVKPLAFVFILVTAIHFFAVPSTFMTLEGLLRGILYSLRIYSLIAAVFIFVETTPAGRLAEAFDFLPESISQVLVLSLLLLPDVAGLSEKVLNAQRSRGLDFRSPNLFRTYVPVLVPIFAKTLERSNRMALAMEARGFGRD